MRKLGFWVRYWGIMVLFGVMSILSIVVFPLAFYIRYHTSKDWLWFLLNPETDFGEQWWKEEHNIKKDTFWSAWRWTFRNSAWGFKTKAIVPKGTKEYAIYEVIKNTLNRGHLLEWASKRKELYGTNHVYYTVNNEIYGRYSYADEFIEIQLGSAGNRYKLHLPVNPVRIYKSLKHNFK